MHKNLPGKLFSALKALGLVLLGFIMGLILIIVFSRVKSNYFTKRYSLEEAKTAFYENQETFEEIVNIVQESEQFRRRATRHYGYIFIKLEHDTRMIFTPEEFEKIDSFRRLTGCSQIDLYSGGSIRFYLPGQFTLIHFYAPDDNPRIYSNKEFERLENYWGIYFYKEE